MIVLLSLVNSCVLESTSVVMDTSGFTSKSNADTVNVVEVVPINLSPA